MGKWRNFYRNDRSCGWGLVELEKSLAETSKSRRLGDRLKATTGKFGKTFLQRSDESSK